MKQFLHINDTMANRISFWHYTAFLLTLPFDFFYNQLVVVSLAVHTLIHLTKERLRQFGHIVPWQVMAVYVVGLAGMLYSRDRPAGWDLAGRQTVMIVLPVIMSLNALDLARYKEKLLHIFGVGCVLTILYLYADALRVIAFYHLPLKRLVSLSFMNHNFSLPIELHATYLSLYAALSFVAFLYFFSRAKTRLGAIYYTFCLAVLAAGLLQLSSRAVCIALLVILNGVFPFMVFGGKLRWRIFFAMLVVSVSLLLFISTTASFRFRYFSELKKDVTDQRYNNELTDPRMARWGLGMELVKQAPLIGHGSGSEVRLLKEAYFNNRLYSSFVNAFNAHSQYLSLLIKTGIAGLFVYLLVLYMGLKRAFRKRDIVFTGFMLLIIIVSSGENLLDVNKGIFFYSFFFSFFLLGCKGVNNVDKRDEAMGAPGATRESVNTM